MSTHALRERRIQGLDRGQVQSALRDCNPHTPAAEIDDFVQVFSLVFDVVAALTKYEWSEIARDRSQLRAALDEVLGRTRIKERGDVERSRGSGLGAVIGFEEGCARLESYATSTKLEDWAGEVVGAGQIEKLFGIKRSTLSSWYQQGAVIGLLRGQRKLAYPIEQFLDARPLEGLDELLKLAPDSRSAWLWARQPHAALGGRPPVEGLRKGQRASVIAAAKRDFA